MTRMAVTSSGSRLRRRTARARPRRAREDDDHLRGDRQEVADGGRQQRKHAEPSSVGYYSLTVTRRQENRIGGCRSLLRFRS
ncbi:MAG: hypothetical protein U5P41_04920 [Gammaproteobacteria bacterium]|nr:hypothetical protein [Gammaproteobacteria bacterium]